MHFKMSSGKWRPFCLGLNVLKVSFQYCIRCLITSHEALKLLTAILPLWDFARPYSKTSYLSKQPPGGWFNIKIPSYQHLISTMRLPILVRCHLYIESGPWFWCFSSSPPSAAYMRQSIRSTVVQIMACRLFGAKPLSKPMLGYCQLNT